MIENDIIFSKEIVLAIIGTSNLQESQIHLHPYKRNRKLILEEIEKIFNKVFLVHPDIHQKFNEDEDYIVSLLRNPNN